MSLDNNGNYHLLFGVSANTSQYEYQNSRHFLSILDQELRIFTSNPKSKSEYIIFTGVDEKTFHRDFLDPVDGLIDFETYSTTQQLILVKMESHTHGFTHRAFDNLLHDKLRDMNNANEHIRPFGSAHVQGKERIKRADESYKPRRLPSYRTNKWPSLVVEVGYSEVQQKLGSDVDWWLTQSDGDVKSVITIAVNKRIKEITICRWHGTGRVYRNVLSQNGRRAVKNTDPNPLVITFEHLFLRLPLGIEKDIIFTVDELKKFAQDIWEVEFEA